MGSDVKIRAADYTDYAPLVTWLTLERDDLNLTPAAVNELALTLTRRKHGSPVYVAEPADGGGPLVGVASVTRDSRHAHVGMLRVHVRRGHRRGGLGSALVERTLESADTAGLTRIIATPYVQQLKPIHWSCGPRLASTALIAFFERHGFEQEGYMRDAASLLGGGTTDVALLARLTPAPVAA